MTRRTAPGILVVVWIAWAASFAAFASDQTPTVDECVESDHVVTGTADPYATPITIYDVASGDLTEIGSGTSIDQDGNFAVSVDPPLSQGQEIKAVDANGRESAVIVVGTPEPPTQLTPSPIRN